MDRKTILKLLGLKVLVGMVVGLLVDLSVGGKKRHGEMESGHMDIGHVCEHEHCRCEDGIVKSASPTPVPANNPAIITPSPITPSR